MRNLLDKSSIAQSLDGDRLKGSLLSPQSIPRSRAAHAQQEPVNDNADVKDANNHEAVCAPSEPKPIVGPYRERLQLRETSMKIGKTIFAALLLVGVFSPAQALTQQELVAKLESAGYSQIREIKSTAEGTSVKAMKNGKEVSLVVDSSGQIQERR